MLVSYELAKLFWFPVNLLSIVGFTGGCLNYIGFIVNSVGFPQSWLIF